MKRRTTAMNGCVKFPVNDPAFYNTNEGGMFVKLVVCDNREQDNRWEMCCGATVNDLLSECLVGDDQRSLVGIPDEQLSVDNVIRCHIETTKWIRYHFPNFEKHDIQLDAIEHYLSRDYLASILLGSTGWSGRHSETNTCWHCTFNDLTEEGQALYKQIKSLYPECVLHLLTFLDT